MKLKHLATAAVSAAILGAAGGAGAATWVSYFDYSNTGTDGAVVQRPGVASDDNAWGKVTVTENDGYLDLTVDLFNPAIKFINTGGNNSPDSIVTFGRPPTAGPPTDTDPHNPFTFNMNGAYGVTVLNTGSQTFAYVAANDHKTGEDFNNTPFGGFTDRIACCGGANGSGAGSPDVLHFKITAAGITFAGAGESADPITGHLNPDFGDTGPHLFSNHSGAAPGSWWFAADVSDGTNTFIIAARDAYCTTCQSIDVPEPATWALMVSGFGAAGALIRRRRGQLA